MTTPSKAEANAQKLLAHMRRTGLVLGHHFTSRDELMTPLLETLGMDSDELLDALKTLTARGAVTASLPMPPNSRRVLDPEAWKLSRYSARMQHTKPQKKGKGAKKKTHKPSDQKRPIGPERERKPPRAPQPPTPAATPQTRESIDIDTDLAAYIEWARRTLAVVSDAAADHVGWWHMGQIPCARTLYDAEPNLSMHSAKELIGWLQAGSILMTCREGCSHLNMNENLLQELLSQLK